MLKKALLLFLAIGVFAGGYTAYKKRYHLALWWELQRPQPRWAIEQIERDFSPFSQITTSAIDETFAKICKSNSHTFRYQIVDGHISRTPTEDPTGRAPIFDRILARLNKAKKLPQLDFIVCMNDGVPEGSPDFWITPNQAPVLAWAKKKDLAPYIVLIPDFLTTRESCWNVEIDVINEKYQTVPWEKREEKAFWRGASNDKGYSLENYPTRPRFLISLLSRENPAQIDAGFCRVYPTDVEQLFQQMGLILGNVPIAGHLDYKYLPVLDGYMCTFPGFQWRLLSGSLTFKQESDEIQYFYGALKPYEHYVPVKNDLSDLLEKIRWAKAHDAECQAIAKRARVFALENLMPEQIYAYLYYVLEKVAVLQYRYKVNSSSPSKA